MLLTEIAPLEDWFELENKIQDRCGLDISVFDVSGKRITGKRGWVNRICPAIKATKNGQAHICAVAHNNVVAMARRSKKPIIEECDAGLLKAAVPLFANGEFVGMIAGCGLLPKGEKIDRELIARTTGIEEREIAELQTDISTISEEEIEKTIALISAELKESFKKLDT